MRARDGRAPRHTTTQRSTGAGLSNHLDGGRPGAPAVRDAPTGNRRAVTEGPKGAELASGPRLCRAARPAGGGGKPQKCQTNFPSQIGLGARRPAAPARHPKSAKRTSASRRAPLLPAACRLLPRPRLVPLHMSHSSKEKCAPNRDKSPRIGPQAGHGCRRWTPRARETTRSRAPRALPGRRPRGRSLFLRHRGEGDAGAVRGGTRGPQAPSGWSAAAPPGAPEGGPAWP
jgi:hypothetical protein